MTIGPDAPKMSATMWNQRLFQSNHTIVLQISDPDPDQFKFNHLDLNITKVA